MYPIKESQSAELNKSLRNEMNVKITFGVVDPDASGKATITVNTSAKYSNNTNFDNLSDVETPYESLEVNRFTLDGKCTLPPNTAVGVYQGYVSEVQSDANCNFTAQPTITIRFSESIKIAGFTFDFDVAKGDFASEFNTKLYNGATLVYNDDSFPTSSRFAINKRFEVFNKVVFTFKKTSTPFRRLYINRLYYGVIDTLNTVDISRCSLSRNVDLLSMELPKHEFTFDIFDLKHDYDPENPDNLLEFLTDGQQVAVELATITDSGEEEWIPLINAITDGTSSVSDDQIAKIVTINATSYLDLMTGVYHMSAYNASGVTLYDMAVECITQSGVPLQYQIDSSLKNFKTKIVPQNVSYKNMLQTIANAANCALYIDRYGVLHITKKEFGTSEFAYDLSNELGFPSLNRISQLKNVIANYYTTNVAASVSELTSVDVTGAVANEFEIEYAPATNITYTTTGLKVIGTPKIYATKLVISVTGTGIIKVSGKVIETTPTKMKFLANEVGTDLEIDNLLLNTASQCTAYCTAIANYYAKRNSYEFENRGFPQLDCADNVTTEVNFDVIVPSKIIEFSLDFNGTLSGNTKVISAT